MSGTQTSEITDHLAAVCRRVYPGLRSQRVLDLQRISDGWECDVYRFDLAGETQTGPERRQLILRLYLGNGAEPKAKWEFRVLRSLAEAGYPVPRVDTVVAENSPLGHPFTLMERVDGTILGRAMMDADSAAERQRYLSLFCELLVRLHQIDWRPFVADPDDYRADAALQRWVNGMRGLLHELGTHDFDDAFRWLEVRAPEIAPGRLAVAHWDFHPWNVLLRADGTPAVIDWTTSEVTDSRFDLAWTLLLVTSAAGEKTRSAVLKGYERLVGQPVIDLEFFEVATALRRISSMVVSLLVGSEAFGMRAGAEVQMRENLTHLSTAYALFQSRTGLSLPAAEAVLAQGSTSPR